MRVVRRGELDTLDQQDHRRPRPFMRDLETNPTTKNMTWLGLIPPGMPPPPPPPGPPFPPSPPPPPPPPKADLVPPIVSLSFFRRSLRLWESSFLPSHAGSSGADPDPGAGVGAGGAEGPAEVPVGLGTLRSGPPGPPPGIEGGCRSPPPRPVGLGVGGRSESVLPEFF